MSAVVAALLFPATGIVKASKSVGGDAAESIGKNIAITVVMRELRYQESELEAEAAKVQALMGRIKDFDRDLVRTDISSEEAARLLLRNNVVDIRHCRFGCQEEVQEEMRRNGVFLERIERELAHVRELMAQTEKQIVSLR